MRQFGELLGPFVGFDGFVHGREDAVGDRAQQRLLVGEVPVQRTGLDVQGGGQTPHGEVRQTVLVENGDGPVDHVRAMELH